ncbi:hypothetical protein DH2020_038238 [Rehmannia glutinosa]|uniref:Uncharacterized protein n=1 Tax=Rehmannia glutinosa TaxID=99300 RepID=A0ABR0V136_REHGL
MRKLRENYIRCEKGRLRDFYAQPRKENKILLKTETVSDDGMSEKVMRKRCASAMEISTKIDWIKEEGSKETDCEALPVGNADKKQDILEFSLGDYKPCLDLTPHDVVRVIGQRLFGKQEKQLSSKYFNWLVVAMHLQQKIFSFQIFELHRLVKVQKLISRSPEKFHENNFDPNRPSIQFPPMNKLLYVTPLDPSPAVAKPKIDPDKSSGSGTVSEMLPLPKTDTEKRHLAQQPTPKLSTDAKLAPWYFHAPVGNQWLVPLRSPSEGLVYKPYPGPCFPANGFAPPVYGNCGPITFGVPAPYTMPPINASGSNIEAEQIPSGGVQIAELDTNSPTDNANFAIPLEKETEKDALSLFPTTPSFHALEDQKGDDQKAKVIKVVPHSRKSASASAARIFQSIQEERNIHRLSSYTSHVS